MDENETQPAPVATEEAQVYEMYYRFVKLNSGDDILCQVPKGLETDQLLLVRFPMKIISMYDPAKSESMFALHPWIPYTAQEIVAVNKRHVISITNVRPEIRKMYDKRVEMFMVELYNVQSLEEYLTESMPQDEQPATDQSQDEIQEDTATEGGPKPWVN